MPVLLFVAYFLDLALTGDIAWSIHLWLGATVLASVMGLLVSYLLVPPATVLAVRRLRGSTGHAMGPFSAPSSES